MCAGGFRHWGIPDLMRAAVISGAKPRSVFHWLPEPRLLGRPYDRCRRSLRGTVAAATTTTLTLALCSPSLGLSWAVSYTHLTLPTILL
eukprot:6779646-Pyramimonas_sp.AAC.1